jgi:general secretion pathway protein F
VATFRYRAATASGEVRTGTLEAASSTGAVEQLRRLGLLPIQTTETKPASAADGGRIGTSSAMRMAVAQAVGELAVLLGAGLTLDRALGVCVDNIQRPQLKAAFAALHVRVKEGVPLSRAMAESNGLFPTMACAMAEAGEADGRLAAALARLAETLDRAETLRRTIVSSMVYPAILVAVAVGVILIMLLVVVPQFEGLFSDAQAKLPMATRVVMSASRLVRAWGLPGLALLVVAGALGLQWLKRPGVRARVDRGVLRVPQLGPLIASLELSRFSRVLSGLVDGGVPLPTAMSIAQRSVSNTHMAGAIGRVAAGLKTGAGLSGPLAATGVFPAMALGFIRTGEETAQLGLMLDRLADVLDRESRTTVERLIALLTPSITVFMGLIVGTVIASLITAILGFNDLALAP